MTVQQIAVVAAILLIPLGVLLIGIGTRAGASGPAPDHITPPQPPSPTPDPLPELAGLAGPADPPQDVEDPAPPLTTIETRPFGRVVPAGHESTADERRDGRRRVGPELDADLAEVIRLIETRPPELRGLLMNASTAVVAQELALLRAYLRGALTGLDGRLREGPLQEDDRAVTACLVSGLGRLPVHHGAAFHRAHRGDLGLDAFFPGSLLVEPAFARADQNAFPAGGIGTGPLVDYAIWSESGRRTPLLVGHTDTVLFTTGSRFRVLAVDQQHGQVTVFLAEEPDRPCGRGRRQHQVLEHLRERATTAGVGPIDGPAPAPVFHPGLDAEGRPYAERTSEPESVL